MSRMQDKELPRVDRRAMARSFGAAADTYDDAADLQAMVRAELLERAVELRIEPKIVVDLGAGTGAGTPGLKALHPRALVCAVDIAPAMLQRAAARLDWGDRHLPWRRRRRFECVAADTLRLPFADGSIDFIFSSLMLQWCDDPDAVFAEIRRVLSPRGLFLFSSLGPTTLQELRSAWAEVDSHPHVNEFIDVHDLGSALARAGFTEPVLDVDRHVRRYADVNALLRSLQSIGARNTLEQRNRGLTGKSAFAAMRDAYTRIAGTASDVPATWEIVYGCCFGAAADGGRHRTQATNPHGETLIPVGSIKRR